MSTNTPTATETAQDLLERVGISFTEVSACTDRQCEWCQTTSVPVAA